jgi:uncharacterized protein TIGR03905
MKKVFKPSGVCSQNIEIEIEDGIIKSVRFIGGCSGNTQGVARLVEGRPVDEVIDKLKDIKCGFKNTSCPAQLAKALAECKNSESA